MSPGWLISDVNWYLSSRSTSGFAEEIQNLPLKMTKCVDIGGEYFENEQKEFLKNNKQF